MYCEGEYFKPRSSKAIKAKICILGKTAEVRVDGEKLKDNLAISDIRRENIIFRDGSLFVLQEQLCEESFAKAVGRFESSIVSLEELVGHRVMLSIVLLCALVGLMFYALLSSVSSIAGWIPEAWEADIGRFAYESMLSNGTFEPSKLSNTQKEKIHNQAQKLALVAQLPYSVEVLFHNSESIGANALAFPAGPIVITDALVRLLSEEQVVAVVAHELAHIKLQHGLQQIVETTGFSIVATMLFGSSEAFVELLTSLGMSVWFLSNSREFEREADLEGIELLKSVDINPSHFIEAIKVLSQQHCKGMAADDESSCEAMSQIDWLSSHPSGQERLEYLRTYF